MQSKLGKFWLDSRDCWMWTDTLYLTELFGSITTTLFTTKCLLVASKSLELVGSLDPMPSRTIRRWKPSVSIFLSLESGEFRRKLLFLFVFHLLCQSQLTHNIQCVAPALIIIADGMASSRSSLFSSSNFLCPVYDHGVLYSSLQEKSTHHRARCTKPDWV